MHINGSQKSPTVNALIKNIFNSTKTKQNKKLTKLPFSLRISLRFSRSDFRLRSLQYLILGAEGCKHAR
ncbi:hypothetical protein Q3G72_022634 [Acer saccharum]|nr:hypothetical protein Q3G72_022634 [Acer saccharum]